MIIDGEDYDVAIDGDDADGVTHSLMGRSDMTRT